MLINIRTILLIGVFFTLFQTQAQVTTAPKSPHQQLTKVKDFVIYDDEQFYSAFPSVIKKPDGEYMVAFRRAPNRKAFGEKRQPPRGPQQLLGAGQLHGWRKLDKRTRIDLRP